MRGTKQNIKWDSLISFAWFSCQYAAETLRYTRNLNQNITSEREKTPKLKCYLFEASLSIRVVFFFFFALLKSHGKFFKGLHRVCWHMIYPFRWRLAKVGVDTWEKRLMGRTEKAGVEYVCWHSHNNLPNHNHPSVRRALLRPPETGLFSSGSSTENFLRESRSTFIAQEPELFPIPPFPEPETSKGKRGCPPASSSGQQGALHQNTPGAPTWREVRGTVWLELQSPFSSSFCKLFCILK